MVSLSESIATGKNVSMNNEYTPAHRAFEITSIAVFGAIFIFEFIKAPWAPYLDGVGWAYAVVAAFTGLMAADFVSGLVHWLADSFGRKSWPFLGTGFIRPFREHHDDPTDITKHDFIEVNGNSAVCILLFLPFVATAQALAGPQLSAWISVWTIAFTATIFMTNQIHSWAHSAEVNPFVGFLQKHRIILNPDDHEIHHTPPHDSYFCISFGWCNPILKRLKFFERVHFIPALFLPTAEEDEADRQAQLLET